MTPSPTTLCRAVAFSPLFAATSQLSGYVACLRLRRGVALTHSSPEAGVLEAGEALVRLPVGEPSEDKRQLRPWPSKSKPLPRHDALTHLSHVLKTDSGIDDPVSKGRPGFDGDSPAGREVAVLWGTSSGFGLWRLNRARPSRDSTRQKVVKLHVISSSLLYSCSFFQTSTPSDNRFHSLHD